MANSPGIGPGYPTGGVPTAGSSSGGGSLTECASEQLEWLTVVELAKVTLQEASQIREWSRSRWNR